MFIADAHCDTLYAIAKEQKDPRECMACAANLRAGGVGLQTFALFTGRKGTLGTPYQDALDMLDTIDQLDLPILTGDLPASPPTTPTGIISIEGGEALEGKMERLYEFDQRARVRMIALTWNFENEIGHPAKLNKDQGLKPFGLALLKEMDRLGIYADVSHLNEAGFWDVCEHMTLPPVATHSNFRELCDVPRNLWREQVQAVIDKKGFIGMNFYPRFLAKSGETEIKDVVRHVDAIADMGGIDILGFGSDFDGIEVQPKGLENASCFPDLIDALLRHGYTQTQVEKMAGLNFWNLLKRGESVRARA